MARYKRLGDILISEGMITDTQLGEALKKQESSGDKLGELLVKLGYVDERQIAVALSKQLGIAYISKNSGKLKPVPDQNLEELIPHDFAMKNVVLPLSRSLNSITVVMADPLDLIVIDNIKKMTGCEVNIVVSIRQDILEAIEQFYGKEKMFRSAIEASKDDEGEGLGIKEISSEETDLSLDKMVAQAEEAPVVKLVDLIIRQAIEED
ncbi:MAG: hypothetical protein K9L94_01755, partial [Candidatus Omnitrophica bacterium]|nr:hypothetical protein [Candidatus Omnitrophota bacterium]